ncbi:unnamed protein product [Fusarium graminearum]|nr:unnamed protein product [Fusarium graminearum]CAG1995392.1 unnamed protein product [Fusarium graminearum]CAG2004424.1 unnamed protein product [Fusarium graminearum]VTO91457.1 unnamed protein product [Fusarium graminearum]
MAESVQTHSAGPPRPDYAAPMVTTLAAIEERGVVHGRQDRDQCGFFMFPSMICRTQSGSSRIALILETYDRLIYLGF